MDEVKPRTVIQNGPIRTVITTNSKALAVLTVAGRNKVMRESLEVALWKWRDEFLAKRFTDYVRRAPFNYLLSPRYARAKKARGAPPLVGIGKDAGFLRSIAPTGKITCRATKGNVRGIVTIPRGNRQNRPAVRILGTVPSWEIAAVARWFGAELVKAIDRGIYAQAVAKQARRNNAATVAQVRASIRAPRRSAGTARSRKAA